MTNDGADFQAPFDNN